VTETVGYLVEKELWGEKWNGLFIILSDGKGERRSNGNAHLGPIPRKKEIERSEEKRKGRRDIWKPSKKGPSEYKHKHAD